MVTDSGTEVTSEEFSQFLQAYGIHGTTTSPEAHRQSGKIERHGQFLQNMLNKMDSERAVSSYQMYLNQATQAKNVLSVRHGNSPELIVFGKQSRLPGSVLSDESIPSHLTATQESESMSHQQFKLALQIREVARRSVMQPTTVTSCVEPCYDDHVQIGV